MALEILKGRSSGLAEISIEEKFYSRNVTEIESGKKVAFQPVLMPRI